MTGDGARTFEWDAENRLVAVTKGTHRSEFGYDGFGHRVDIRELDANTSGAWITSVDTKYVWEGTQILESRNADGSATLQHYYAQGFVDSDGTNLYYTRDHLGSTRELVDALGAIRARYDYDPYGRVTKISGDKDSSFLYTGDFWHAQSGLYLTLYREYDPDLARWLNRDQIEEFGGMNLYAYCLGDPINAVDLYGNDIWIEGPNVDEPQGHMSINVGDPNGHYDSYSFGVDGHFTFDPSSGLALEGDVYRDWKLGGDILKDYYLHTNCDQDARAKAILESMVGKKAPYEPWMTCRTFSLGMFNQFKDAGIGIPGAPPYRAPSPGAGSTDVPSSGSSSAWDQVNLRNVLSSNSSSSSSGGKK
jgi:RHS repeat-associated protein